MLTLNEGNNDFKAMFESINKLTSDIENCSEPVCILSLLYSEDMVADVLMLGFNSAFRAKVNPKVMMHSTLKNTIPLVVDFWLDKLGAAECTGKPVEVFNYAAFSTGLVFEKVIIYPFRLLDNHFAFGLVFEKTIKQNHVYPNEFEAFELTDLAKKVLQVHHIQLSDVALSVALPRLQDQPL